jgi:protein tyrosine/serine phosphatase
MDTIFRGDLASRRGRVLAWADSMFVDHGLLRLAWSNFGTVVPGRLYRCNHPTPGRLAALTRRYRLRTLLNLRGPTGNGSDALSREQAARLGLAFLDVPLRSGLAPPRERVLELVEVFGNAAEPMLLHCKSGADRAGFAAGVFLLLTGGSTADALAQLSWRFGHLRNSRAGVLDAFFLRFARDAEGRKAFIDWLRDDYLESELEAAPKRLSSFLSERVLARE